MNINEKVVMLTEYRAAKPSLPPGRHVRWAADLLTLHREDETMVAAFSNRGAVWTRVAKAAADDLHDTDQSTA